MKRPPPKPLPEAAPPARIPTGMPISRQQRLREALPASVDCLHRRRADMIEDGFIDDYVALHWLEWHGGSLRLTITGTNVCQQLAGQANP